MNPRHIKWSDYVRLSGWTSPPNVLLLYTEAPFLDKMDPDLRNFGLHISFQMFPHFSFFYMLLRPHPRLPQGHDFVGHVGVLHCAAVVAGVGGVRTLGVFLWAAPCRGCGPHRTSAMGTYGNHHL